MEDGFEYLGYEQGEGDYKESRYLLYKKKVDSYSEGNLVDIEKNLEKIYGKLSVSMGHSKHLSGKHGKYITVSIRIDDGEYADEILTSVIEQLAE